MALRKDTPPKVSRTPDFPEILYHYTGHDAFAKILESGHIWAHDARLSNDRRETDYALGLITVAIDGVSKTEGFDQFIGRLMDVLHEPGTPFRIRDISNYVLVASFSEEPNLLSQWRAYAPENGYAIGFDTTELRANVERSRFLFGKVQYDFNKAVTFLEQRLRKYLRECIELAPKDEPSIESLARFCKLLETILPLVKHESFSEEREWRAFLCTDGAENIRFYSGRRSLTPYRPIPLTTTGKPVALREVIVGPSDDHHQLASWTSDYLRNLGYETRRAPQGTGVRVVVSGSPYRLKR